MLRRMITEQLFFFSAEQLHALADQHRDAYRSAEPFPHAIIDNFLPEPVLDEVLDEFPSPNEIEWRSFYAQFEKKMISKDESQLGPRTRHLIAQLHSSTAIRFLERLSGITGLVPDPHLLGGGGAVEPRHLQIQQQDIRAHGACPLNRLRAVAGLPHHFEARLQPQDQGQPLADNFVIIGDENADNRWHIADGLWQMAYGGWRMAYRRWRTIAASDE